jgi:GcrA cell cycle regulator
MSRKNLWPPEQDDLLRQLWFVPRDDPDRLDRAGIARRLGVGENAVIGRSGRLKLGPRPGNERYLAGAAARWGDRAYRKGDGAAALANAIKVTTRAAKAATEKPEPTPAPTVNPTALPSDTEPQADSLPYVAPASVYQMKDAPKPVIEAPPPRPVLAFRLFAKVKTCCWPIGDPGTRDFRLCDDPVEGKGSYCEDHATIAYEKHGQPRRTPRVDYGISSRVYPSGSSRHLIDE